MEKTIDWINTIINELVDPSKKLKDTLLKVQLLAFKIKNNKLKEWAEKELKGYKPEDVPTYRIVTTSVIGNLIQDRGFGNYVQRNNHPLPIESLEKKYYDILKSISMNSSVSELEHMIDSGKNYKKDIPFFVNNEITKVLTNDWHVDSAWQYFSLNSIEGIVSSIKSNLLTFLMELAEEIGENDNLNIKEDKKKIDNLFDKTIGNISASNVNILFGNENIQTTNSGDDSNLNIVKGEKINQTIKIEVKEELSKFISNLTTQLNNLSLKDDNKKNILNEISKINTQLKQDKPKVPIIHEGLNIIHGILIGVVGNALTEPILDKLSWLISQF